MNTVIPLVSSIVSFLFAITVLDLFLAHRKPYQLMWFLGLLIYAISTLMEFIDGINGISVLVYQLWYLFGAILVAAYLGMGTIYRVASRRTAHLVLIILVIASLYAAIRVFTVSPDLSKVSSELSGKGMPSDVRALTPIFNIFGTISLVGGAIYSAWEFRRNRMKFYKVLSNIIIAIGAILPALGGLVSRFGGTVTATYILELIGIIVIFIGFLRSRQKFGLLRIPFIHGFHRVNIY